MFKVTTKAGSHYYANRIGIIGQWMHFYNTLGYETIPAIMVVIVLKIEIVDFEK